MQRTLAAVALIAFAIPAAAQKSDPVELGVDAALVFGLDSPTTTTLSLPASQIRAGFMVNPSWSIEPMLGLTYFNVSGTGGGSSSIVTAGVGALYHFTKRSSGSQVYVRPFLQTTHFSTSGGSSSNTTSWGGGLGIKVPVVNRIAMRYEAAIGTSSNTTNLMFLAGLSVFTH